MSPAVVADPVPGIMTDQTSGPTSCKPAARSSSMEQERNRLRSLISRHPKYREDRRSFLGTYDGLGALPKHKLVALATTLGIDTAGLSQRSARGVTQPPRIHEVPCPSSPPPSSCTPSLADASSEEEGSRPRRKPESSGETSTTCTTTAKSSSSVWVAMRNALRSAISKHSGYLQNRRHYLRGYPALSHLPRSDLVAVAVELGIDLRPFGVVANSRSTAATIKSEEDLNTASASAVEVACSSDGTESDTPAALKNPPKRPRLETAQCLSTSAIHVSSVRNRACVSAIEDPSDVPSLAASSPSPSGRSVASSTSSPSSRPAQQSSSVTCQQSLREQQQQQQQQQLRHIGIDFPSTFLTGFTPLGSDQFHPLSVDSMSMTPCEFPEPRPVTLGLGTAEALGFASSADFMDIPIDIAQPNSPFSSFFNSSTPRPAGSPPPSNLAAFQTTDASATEPVAPSLKTLSHSDVRTFLEDVFKPDPIPESISKAFNENAVDMEVVRSSHFTSDLLVRHLKLSVADAMRIIEARIDITAVRSA